MSLWDVTIACPCGTTDAEVCTHAHNELCDSMGGKWGGQSCIVCSNYLCSCTPNYPLHSGRSRILEGGVVKLQGAHAGALPFPLFCRYKGGVHPPHTHTHTRTHPGPAPPKVWFPEIGLSFPKTNKNFSPCGYIFYHVTENSFL